MKRHIALNPLLMEGIGMKISNYHDFSWAVADIINKFFDDTTNTRLFKADDIDLNMYAVINFFLGYVYSEGSEQLKKDVICFHNDYRYYMKQGPEKLFNNIKIEDVNSNNMEYVSGKDILESILDSIKSFATEIDD